MCKSIIYHLKNEKCSKCDNYGVHEFHEWVWPTALGHSNYNAVAKKLTVDLHVPDGTFLFQDV